MVNSFASVITSPRIIALIIKDEPTWILARQGGRMRKFMDSFEQAACAHGVQIIPIFLSEKTRLRGVFPTDLQELNPFIDKLGSRYLGSLLVDTPLEFSETIRAMNQLLDRKHPLVWFDYWHQGEEYTLAKQHQRFFCGATDNMIPIYQLGLESLQSVDHQQILCPFWWHSSSLNHAQIFKNLSQANQNAPGNIHISLNPLFQLHSKSARQNWKEDTLKTLHTTPSLKKAYGDLTVLQSTLAAANLEQVCTFFDRHGQEHQLHQIHPNPLDLYRELPHFDAEPSHKKILAIAAFSVANLLIQKIKYGITAILTDHEYEAFHFILGDRKIPRDQKGRLFSQPYMVHRGSIQKNT